MARTEQIDLLIAERTTDLQAAQTSLGEATQALALNPSDKDCVARARKAKAIIADLTPEIESLQIAREQAVRYDASDEAKAARALCADKAETAKAHANALQSAGSDVDAAAMALMVSLVKWRKSREAAHSAYSEHQGLLPITPDEAMSIGANMHMHLGDTSPNATYALACIVSDLIAVSGLHMSQLVATNCYGYEGFNPRTGKFGNGRMSMAGAGGLIAYDANAAINNHERRYA